MTLFAVVGCAHSKDGPYLTPLSPQLHLIATSSKNSIIDQRTVAMAALLGIPLQLSPTLEENERESPLDEKSTSCFGGSRL